MNVKDVLGLPSMKNAKVLAGSEHLNRLVTSVSVLEVSDPAIYKKMPVKGEYSGNELILTSFAQVADEVEKQLEIVELLNNHHQLGIILYYVGMILPEVDSRLTKRMEELGMILLCMPSERTDLRYTEVLSEAFDFIYSEEYKIIDQQQTFIESIRALPKSSQQLETGLSILSDQLKCSLILCNQEEILMSKTWPRSLDETVREYLNEEKSESHEKNQHIFLNQKEYFRTDMSLQLTGFTSVYQLVTIRKNPFTTKQLKGIQAIIISMIKFFGEQQLRNLAQQFFVACENHDYHTAASLAAKEGIYPEQGFDLYYGCPSVGEGFKKSLNSHYSAMIFYQSHADWVVAGPASNSFFDVYDNQDQQLIIIRNLVGFEEVTEWMRLIDTHFEALGRVFPIKKIFSAQDIYLLLDVTEKNREIVQSYAYRQIEQGIIDSELIATLSVFFLDCNESISLTAERLYVHKNTIKYRLKRAKELLELDYQNAVDAYFYIKILAYIRRFINKY